MIDKISQSARHNGTRCVAILVVQIEQSIACVCVCVCLHV